MDGILIVDKPDGMTSHDVVDFIRRRFGVKKAGHAGTLDPFATGVLVVLIGKATKAQGRFINDDKTYEGTIVFGASTDTGDRCGRLFPGSAPVPDESAIRRILEGFKGKIRQTPPMFSAKKINGKRLYKLARKGLEVPREPKTVEVKNIELKKFDPPFMDFRTSVSKGAYIRQLAHDIGRAAGCGAYLKSLRRIASGRFTVAGAIDFSRLKDIPKEELNENILRLEEL